MAPEAASAWGWRVPFFIGCAIVPFLYIIRRKLQETPEFAARKVHPTTAQVFATLGANWPIVLGGVAMVIMTTVSFYLITVYTPTFGRGVLKLTESDALLVTIAVAASNFVWLPISGAVSDRIGRKDRSQADLGRLRRSRPADRLSGARLAREGANVRPDARGGTVAVVHLCLL
jgi:MHS family citrate/tricarballylate:H+ symporter-like MFS transporter